MIAEGQIVLFGFPRTDQVAGKLRPALVLRALPGRYDDWLVCMISTRLYHAVPGIDEIIPETDPDFAATGLRSRTRSSTRPSPSRAITGRSRRASRR